MQTKIFGAVVLGAALALVGCSGNGGGSSTSTSGSTGTSTSTGTTGTGSTTGNPTTTTSSGSGGSSGACGTCASGETCQRFTKQNGAHVNACACTPVQVDQNGNVTAPDTCAGNTATGMVICDEFTFTCRLPQEFENANGYPDGGLITTTGNQLDPKTCDFQHGNNGETALGFCNYGVTNGQCDPVPADAGPNPAPAQTYSCVLVCQSSADCTTATFCDLSQPLFFVYPDGGDASFPDGGGATGATPLGFCNFNVCGSHVLDDGGTLNSDFFASCNAHGSGDGECLPILLTGAGICYAPNASATDQSICDPSFLNADPANGCAAGALCNPVSSLTGNPGAPGETGTCLPMCNADAPDSGIYPATCSSTFTRGCFGFGEDALVDGGGLNPGICVP